MTLARFMLYRMDRATVAHDPCHQFLYSAPTTFFLWQRPPIVDTNLKPQDLSVRLHDHDMPLFSTYYYSNVK
jgi:hypothetical protein